VHQPYLKSNLVALATKVLATAFAGIALALTVDALIGVPAANAAQPPKNIIIMFADGAAPTQWDFGRYSSRVLRGQPFVTTDIVFQQGTLGMLSTHPSNGYVTDSAAAGSAMSTGHKVNNGAVAVTPDGKPVATVMELAKARGRRIGLVTTEWVMAEAVTLLKARGAVDHALALGEAIQAGRLGYLVESTAERRRRAWDLFVRDRDRRVGWVDCASFALMEELGLGQFFGFDEDFVRAGFTAYR